MLDARRFLASDVPHLGDEGPGGLVVVLEMFVEAHHQVANREGAVLELRIG
ncbi:MAG: hypothetical protein ACRD21_12710 [Vicinamibacteria bacterium]